MFVGVDVRQKLWCKPFSSNTHPLLRSPTTSFRLTYRDLVCLVTYQKDNQYEHIYSFELEAWEMWSTISTLLVVRETCRLMNRRAVCPDRAVRLRQVLLLDMGNIYYYIRYRVVSTFQVYRQRYTSIEARVSWCHHLEVSGRGPPNNGVFSLSSNWDG